MNHLILASSVLFYLCFIFFLLIKVFRKRSASIRSKTTDYKYYKTYSAELSEPPEIAVIANNIQNQFQLPTIYMVTVAVVLQFEAISLWMLISAWMFVATRLLHTYIHLGSNNILKRAKSYMLGWCLVMSMWVQILLYYVTHIGS